MFHDFTMVNIISQLFLSLWGPWFLIQRDLRLYKSIRSVPLRSINQEQTTIVFNRRPSNHNNFCQAIFIWRAKRRHFDVCLCLTQRTQISQLSEVYVRQAIRLLCYSAS